MALELLHHQRVRLGQQRFGVEGVAAVLSFERAGRALHADQRSRAAQHQNETEMSQCQSPRASLLLQSKHTILNKECQPGKATKRPCTEEQDRRGFDPRKQIYAPFLSRAGTAIIVFRKHGGIRCESSFLRSRHSAQLGCLFARLGFVGNHSRAGTQLLADPKSGLRRPRSAVPVGADLGLRPRRMLVRSMRPWLLVSALALLAISRRWATGICSVRRRRAGWLVLRTSEPRSWSYELDW